MSMVEEMEGIAFKKGIISIVPYTASLIIIGEGKESLAQEGRVAAENVVGGNHNEESHSGLLTDIFNRFEIVENILCARPKTKSATMRC